VLIGGSERVPEIAAHAKFRVVIHGSIEDVWNEITRTDAPIAAFFNSRMEVARLAPGSKLAMRTPDGKHTGVVGEILELDPPKRFAHTFKFTSYDDPECRVVYDLEEVAGGVQFTLTVTDLPKGTKTAKQMVRGGKMIVNTLKQVIETGRPSLGTRVLFGVFKLMSIATPKKCLTENWPVDDPVEKRET
jgi:uncharacterized protein YndB with AHSA1/START domain